MLKNDQEKLTCHDIFFTRWVKSRWVALQHLVWKKIETYLILKDPRFYSSKYTGTNSTGILILKNMLRPGRFLKKLKYGQMIPLPSFILSSENPPFKIKNRQESLLWATTLKKDGVIILPGFFQNKIEGIVERYSALPEKRQSTKQLTARYISLMDTAFTNIILNEAILTTLASTFQYLPFVQDIPVITVVDTLRKSVIPQEEEIVTEWHCDDINTLKVLVFLTNVLKTDTRMRIAKRSHKTLRLDDALYSEAYVQSKYDILDCTGPKGTVVIFNSNALHKQQRKPESFRAMLAAKYSTGNGFNFKNKYQAGHFELKRAESLFSGLALSPIQRSAIKGILHCSS